MTGKIWTPCKSEYLPLGKGKVTDVSEGVQGEDRVSFVCAHCGKTHTNATVIR
jgi:hypothetical protein